MASVALSKLLLCSAVTAVPIGQTVGWQEHSKNDLRAWPQLLRKGGRNFKIDPNLLQASACAKQQRVKQDPRGCLVLNHDNPSPFNSRYDYNTTDDVLKFLEDPLNRRYFARAGDPFLVVLCFKHAPAACESSTASQNWRGLIDDLFNTAQQVVARAALNVQFVIDGDGAGGAICDCFKDRWRPWVATYIPDGGQQPGSCLDDAFTSDDPTRGLDRFAILNEPSGSFHSATEKRYGKFVNSSFNWQIYEPRDESEIGERLGEYSKAGVVHAEGLNFAINVDSSMLQVYAAGAKLAGRRGWSDPIVPNGSAPSLVVLPTPTATGRQAMAVAYSRLASASMAPDAPAAQSWYALHSFEGAAGAPLVSEAAGLLPVAAESTPPHVLSSLAWPGSAHGMLATNGDGHVSALHMAEDAASGALSMHAGAVLSNGHVQPFELQLGFPKDVSSATAAAVCPHAAGPEALTCAVQVALDANASLQLRLWALDPTSSARILASVPLAMPSSVPVTADGAAAVCSLGVASDGSVGVALAWSAQGRVAVATASWSPADARTLALVAGPADVGVGHRPHLSFAPVGAGACAGSRGVLLLTAAEGFCFDNERQNKATRPAACEQVPSATPNVLVASYARVEDWEAKLHSAAPAMSGCDAHVMHGAYSRGTNPSAAVFAAPGTALGFSFAEVHEGTRAGTKDNGECGLAVPHDDAIVLAGWVPADVCDVLR